jgi:membrane protein DedA with SNARE-associated domain
LEVLQLFHQFGDWLHGMTFGLMESNPTLFYFVTFAWTFVEGETFVIFAGAAAAADPPLLKLHYLILAAGFGSFCGDQFYFFIGRRYGKYLLRRFPRWQGPVDAALGMLHKYHVGFILSFRFIYGVRNFASFAMGMSEVPWPRFFLLNFLAAAVWAVIFAGSGYLLGRAFEHLLGDIARDFGLVMLGVVLILLAVGLWLNKRRKRTPAPTGKPELESGTS